MWLCPSCECIRWPEALRLLSSTGVLVQGRCGGTNRCDYCARLAAVEIAERISLDAVESGNAPTVWMVLTTTKTDPDPAAFYDARRALMRSIEKKLPGVEWACVVEFTTGYGPRSGGLRRPHWNVLLKNVGIGAHTLALIEDAVRSVWCSRDDVAAQWDTADGKGAQYVGAIEHHGGLTRYLALHFLKESQRPPAGWKGHRFTVSKHTRSRAGYFGQPAWKSRRRAQESLRWKRALYRALLDGYEDGNEANAIAEADVMRAERVRWQLVKLRDSETVDRSTGEISPLARVVALDGSEPTVWRPDRLARFADDAARAKDERAYDELLAERAEGGRRAPDVTRHPPALFTMPKPARFG